MADDLTTLQSSLSDRATALGSYVYSLKADSARSDEGFRRALDVCYGYTQAFVDQLHADWDESASRDERRRTLENSLESFLKRERWIDQRFARGAQRDVPRALKTIARREFRAHGLDGHEPVLTVGPPDSFETHQTSLATFLFTDIYVRLDNTVEALRHGGPDLSIFSVPYIEGTRVLWYPIVLGHEIAHSRLDHANGTGALDAVVDSWLSVRDVEFGTIIDETVKDSVDPPLARVELGQQLVRWATELTCDLNAVRLFGPAGLSAIAEFLAILESQPDEGTLDTATHPPLWVRLKLLFEYLDRMGWGEYDESSTHASVWRAQLEQPHERLDRRSEWLAGIVTDPANMQQLVGLVRDWGPEYAPADNIAAIAHVKAELLDGVPGATHFPGGRKTWTQTEVADVVNAAWAARRILDDRESGGSQDHQGVLLDSGLGPHDKRLKLDSLASKAIDTLELSRLWGPCQGIIPPDAVDPGGVLEGAPSHRPDGTPADSVEGAPSGTPRGGVLSRRCFSQLLGRDRSVAPNKRMVVTPLYADSIQDAAIDLRLGPDFIVFRHSATKAFDPLADDRQDPRMMQERVHKDWGERFILHPQELVLASTLEYIVLPDDVAAQVLTRSSYGRLGLLTATAVQVQPGARGCITLELVNQGETPIELAPAARVAQLMLWSVVDPCEVERGKYWFPVGPEFSKVSEDPDAPALRALAAAAKAPVGLPRPRLRARFEGERSEADEFYDVARSMGADGPHARPVRQAIGDGEPRRLGPETGALFVGIAVSVKILATTVLRWLQGHARGVVITELDGDVTIRTDARLPRGTVVVSSRDGTTIRRLEVPPDDANDIAQAVRRLLP